MRLWYLSHRRPAKAQASLRIRTVSPEPSLFAHTKSRSRRRVGDRISHNNFSKIEFYETKKSTCLKKKKKKKKKKNWHKHRATETQTCVALDLDLLCRLYLTYSATKNQTCSPVGWLRMRVWRMSLRRTKSTIISWDGSILGDVIMLISVVKWFEKSVKLRFMVQMIWKNSLFFYIRYLN